MKMSEISVIITGHKRLERNETYVVYTIELNSPRRRWMIYRRYSEFYALHKKLLEKYPCSSKYVLPPKIKLSDIISTTKKMENLAKSRETKLQAYLQEIMNSEDSTWARSKEFESFLELVPEDRPNYEHEELGEITRSPENISQNAYKRWLRKSMHLALELTSIDETLLNKQDSKKHFNPTMHMYLKTSGYWDTTRRISDANKYLDQLVMDFELLQAHEQTLFDKGIENPSSYHARYSKYIYTINALRKRLNSLIDVQYQLDAAAAPRSQRLPDSHHHQHHLLSISLVTLIAAIILATATWSYKWITMP